MICNGCGGVIGKDCWNPQECEYISYQEQRQIEHELEWRRQAMEHMQEPAE